MDLTTSSTLEQRYARQLILPEIGIDGQEKLAKASVVVVGAGGLGSPILLYLAAAGIGKIGIIDCDVVNVSNLQRQILYHTANLGQKKALLAARRLHGLNPHIVVEAYPIQLQKENIGNLLHDYEIIVDACDNYATRLLLDQYTAEQKKPYVYGSIEGFCGQSSVFNYAGAKGYRDLYPDIKEADDSAGVGVLGATAGVIGSIQAAETLKIALGLPPSLVGKLFYLNLLSGQAQYFSL